MDIKDIKCHNCRNNTSYVLLISSAVVRRSNVTLPASLYYIYFIITNTARTMGEGLFLDFNDRAQSWEISPVDVRSGSSLSVADEGQLRSRSYNYEL